MYAIPRSTLHDHVSSRIKNQKQGPQAYLSPSEEEELAKFLLKCAKMGYPHTCQQILGLVQHIVDNKGMSVVVTRGWWDRFRQRHPHLTLRTTVPLSYVRVIAQDEEVIASYFDLLENTLVQNNILDSPSKIYNCDETGMPLNPKPLKGVCQKGMKDPSHVTGNSKSQISILACTNAAGYALPPYHDVIFDQKKHSITISQLVKFQGQYMDCHQQGGWIQSCSKNGS